MRHVDRSHLRALPVNHTGVGRLAFLFFALVVASCGSSSGTPQQAAPPLGNDASLSSLSITDATLEPAFSATITDYTASVPIGTDSVDVDVTTSDRDAVVSINGGIDTSIPINVGGNTIGILVTAEDGTTTRTYSVVVTRPASNNASLSYLVLRNVFVYPRFDSNQTEYSGTALSFPLSTRVSSRADDPNATIGVNGTVVESAGTSDPVVLDEGSDTIVIDVVAEDTSTTRAYTVTVTPWNTSEVVQKAFLKASNAERWDSFGLSVSLSRDGTTLAVGASYEASAATGVDGVDTDNSAEGAGAVYVFTQNGDGVWAQQAYIKASNTESGDRFGWSVALSGDGTMLAVSAYREDSGATGVNGDEGDNGMFRAGAVYVFTRDSAGVWVQQAYIKASVTDQYDEFGWFVALSTDGTTLAVGAPNAGAVYAFSHDASGVWTERAFLEGGPSFGWSGALSGDGRTLAVGAPWYQSMDPVYVFTRDSSGVWSQPTFVWASNAESGDFFGGSVALSRDGTTLAVGAGLEDGATTGVNGVETDDRWRGSGAAYVFIRGSGDGWTQQAYIKGLPTGGHFGSMVDIEANIPAPQAIALSENGATLTVGAFADGGDAEFACCVEGSGAVYVYTRDGAGVWTTRAAIKASNPGNNDWFTPPSLSDDGTTLVVGAYGEDTYGDGSGAVYIFEL